eukprot:Skav218133  [mRNA]  locus=scaffold759:359643:363895:- [translate_table: standard]
MDKLNRPATWQQFKCRTQTALEPGLAGSLYTAFGQKMSWVYGDAASEGSSAATSASEVPSRRDRSDRSDRTRLSAKAQPFRSSQGLRPGDELGWQPYNAELQDWVYLNFGMSLPVTPMGSASGDAASQGPLMLNLASAPFVSPSSSSTRPPLRERSLDATLPNADEAAQKLALLVVRLHQNT